MRNPDPWGLKIANRRFAAIRANRSHVTKIGVFLRIAGPSKERLSGIASCDAAAIPKVPKIEKVQSRLRCSILTFGIPHKNRCLMGGSLEMFNLA